MSINNAEIVLHEMNHYCMKSTGEPQVWTGKNATYHWTRGKTTDDGIVNGVVRKLAGVNANGDKIWVVAGSFKITSNGEILRFTGLPKVAQKMIEVVVRSGFKSLETAELV
jgi:hypothetical protein